MKTVDDVPGWLRMHQLPYWRVTFNNSKTVAARCPDADENGDLALETSVEFFEQSAQYLNAGTYSIYGRKSEKSMAAETVMIFHVVSAGDQQKQNNSPIPGLSGANDILVLYLQKQDEIAQLRQEKVELDYKHKLELQKAKDKGNSFSIAGLNQLIGNMAKLAETQKGNPPAVGSPKVSTEEESQENDFGKSFNDIADVIGDDQATVIAFKKLATFAKNYPDQFKMYLDSLPQ